MTAFLVILKLLRVHSITGSSRIMLVRFAPAIALSPFLSFTFHLRPSRALCRLVKQLFKVNNCRFNATVFNVYKQFNCSRFMVRWLQIDRLVLLRQDEHARKKNGQIIYLCPLLYRSSNNLFSSAVRFWLDSVDKNCTCICCAINLRFGKCAVFVFSSASNSVATS